MKRVFGSFLVLAATVQMAAAESRLPQGGGYCHAGMDGEYFANPDLDDPPAFARRDVRIDFDWRGERPVGGSIAEPYKSFPREDFSIRWTGQLIPRFSEAYTFAAEADTGIRVSIRLPGGDWTDIIEAWKRARAVERSRPYAMTAGRTYDFRVELRHTRHDGFCTIKWSSPSTPEEVIDALGGNALNLASWSGYCCADKVKEGRWYSEDHIDENGWPTADQQFIVVESHKSMQGTYLLSFKGQARVEAWGAPSSFLVEGQPPSKKLARGEGYDAASNTTRARFTIDDESGIFILKFHESMRTAASPTNSGITELKIMRPMAPGSGTPHHPDEACYRPLKEAVKAFACLRWLGMANENMPGDWAHRTPPGYAFFAGRGESSKKYGENWEYLVLLANETGRDLYLCTPIAADDAYFRKLALLLRFGSDGVEPYDHPVADPKYPPLNPNLRVYFEVGNEIWNWAFGSTQQAQTLAWEAVQKGTVDGKIVNYDGQAAQGIDAMRRWHALRTVRASRTFREVFGDAAMGRRIRPLIEFQYANAQSTAWLSFQFLDGYFNNGRGDFVKDPHPPAYDIWGAGGAAYYGVGNPDGLQDEVKVPDGSFEHAFVADGAVSTNAAGTPWTFKGGAGIFRNLASAVADYQAGKRMRQPKGVALGFRFRTGTEPVYVYQLGRVFDRASDGAAIRIVAAKDKRVVAEGSTGKAQAYLTRIFGYYYATPFATPVRLDADTEYDLLASDLGSSDILDDSTTVQSGAGVTVLAAVRAEGTGDDPAAWAYKDNGKAGTAYGPITFLYSTRNDIAAALPQPPFGQQAAVIRGDGEFNGTMPFEKDGTYALNFNAAGCGQWGQFFDVYVDEQRVSPRGQTDFRTPPELRTHDDQTGFGIGGWGRNNGFKEEWGSAPFTIKAGPHTLRFVARQVSAAKGKSLWTVFDNLTVSSVDAIMTSGFGSGSALGQPAENKWADSQRADSAFGLSLGLPRVAYESGWSLGGDFYQKPIHNYCKFMDDRAQGINDKAVELFTGSGGALDVWGVYIYWPPYDFPGAANYPIMRSIIAADNRLPVEASVGPALPVELAVTNSLKWNWDWRLAAPLKTRGDWRAWVFTAPQAGEAQFVPALSGDGVCEVDVDGVPVGWAKAGVAPPPIKAWLTQGAHGLRVRNIHGEFTVEKVSVQPIPK